MRRRCVLEIAARCVLTAALVAVVACGSGDGTLDEIDPEAAPAEPSYSKHIAPIMDRYCTACHASDAQVGEVEGLGYETCDKVRRNWGGILITVFRGNTMPPGGAYRVTSEDRMTLERWFEQGARCD